MAQCERHDDAGAWVLGALPEQEAGAFAAHVQACEACAAQVRELQAVADVLPRGVEQVPPPPELRDRVMAVVEREASLLAAAGPEADRPGSAAARPAPRSQRRAEGARRGWRRWTFGPRPAITAAVACALLAVGVAAGVVVGEEDEPASRQVAARVDSEQAPLAKAVLRGTGDQAQLAISGLPTPPQDRVYQVWLRRSDGELKPTDALFMPNSRAAATVEVPGGLRCVEEVLVTHEPMGGSQEPTQLPVIAADPS
ncbi:MAG TPA: anti-sigma factor [Solirubrobacteraceae bacterium]|nr:anti-sigma factor [Solirubrobacteraceae bacterium]